MRTTRKFNANIASFFLFAISLHPVVCLAQASSLPRSSTIQKMAQAYREARPARFADFQRDTTLVGLCKESWAEEGGQISTEVSGSTFASRNAFGYPGSTDPFYSYGTFHYPNVKEVISDPATEAAYSRLLTLQRDLTNSAPIKTVRKGDGTIPTPESDISGWTVEEYLLRTCRHNESVCRQFSTFDESIVHPSIASIRDQGVVYFINGSDDFQIPVPGGNLVAYRLVRQQYRWLADGSLMVNTKNVPINYKLQDGASPDVVPDSSQENKIRSTRLGDLEMLFDNVQESPLYCHWFEQI